MKKIQVNIKNVFLRDRKLSDNMKKTYFYVTNAKCVKKKKNGTLNEK